MSIRVWFVLVGVVTLAGPTLTGCAKTTSHTSFVQHAPEKPTPPRSAPPVGERVATVAAYTLDNWPRGFRNDCSGFVEATLSRVGIPLRGSTRMLWNAAKRFGWVHHRQFPRVGDLAFFDDTYDRNHNGRWDDELSHIAIVLDVDDDGTIVLAHAGTSAGRARFVMNLFAPHDRYDEDGARINDALRRGEGSNRATLAAELLRGFASIRP
ncbi:MAG: CHAP domain-containing protein [Myxococcota bacterium]